MRRPWVVHVLLGVALFVVLFVIDASESWFHVEKALRRVKADPEGTEVLRGEVARFVVGMAVGYLALGVYAGLAHAAWQRLVRPRRPIVAGVLALASMSVLANTRHVLVQPPLHDWFLYRSAFVDHLPAEVPLAGMLLFAAVSVWVGWRRAQGDFALRLAPLLALTIPPALAWRVPDPDVGRPNAGPNVIILSFDALRPDHVGFFGYDRGNTPNLDRFLEESTVWTNAFTPLARTYPAWVSLLTGSLPTTHGIRDPLPALDRLVPPVPTLPQELRARGWYTSFLTDDSRFSYMVPEMGFDAIEQPRVSIANFAISGSEPRFRAFYGLLDNPVGWALVPVIRMNQAFGRSYRAKWFNRTTRQAIADASEREKFFLAIHDCTLHSPADRHPPYSQMFDQPGYTGRNRFRYLSLGSVSVADAQPEEAERLAAHQNVNLYDSGMVMVDEAFAGLREQLEASGLWDRSIVVLMSDHGEDFFEEEQRYRFVGPNHGFHAWGNAQHQVLLAVHWPKGLARPPSLEPQLSSLVDVAPTLARELGFPWSGDGRPLFEKDPRTLYIETGVSEPAYWVANHRTYPFTSTAQFYTVDKPTTWVYARPEYVDDVIAGKDRIVMDERWKLVWYAVRGGETRVELFDWRADPLNQVDVARENPEVVMRLWSELVPRLRADGEEPPVDPLAPPPPVAGGVEAGTPSEG